MRIMRLNLLLGVLSTIAGCTHSPTDGHPSPQPPATSPQWNAPLSPEQVKGWSPEEAKAVVIARAAVEQMSMRSGGPAPDIMEFRVTPTPTGWEVYVSFVGAYVDGQPIGGAGYFTVVEVDRNWNVTRLVGGT